MRVAAQLQLRENLRLMWQGNRFCLGFPVRESKFSRELILVPLALALELRSNWTATPAESVAANIIAGNLV